MSSDVLLTNAVEEKLSVNNGDEQNKQMKHKGFEGIIKNEGAVTPSRKISSRFGLSQFYTNWEDDDQIPSSANRTPSKGLESKLMSMWHNVKYGWSGKMRANFSKEQPVWLLGRCYDRKCSPPPSMESTAELETKEGDETEELGKDAIVESEQMESICESIDGFKKDFYSRIWMTYRREFPIMNGSNYTSDCGWGCMLRSGQMLLAQALICHFLGRSWRYEAENQIHCTLEDTIHRKIIRWFGDSSSKTCPFSIHTLVNLGLEMGKKPGDWYGPASVSHLLRQAVKKAAQENADFDEINVYVAQDSTVYIQDVLDECLIPEKKNAVPWQSKRNTSETVDATKAQWKSVIILVPLRLGTSKINTVYVDRLQFLLSTEYCLGIIGGKPKHSLYFIGFQEDKLIHLDPHYCQEMVDVNQEHFPFNSFHCKTPRKTKASKMDPSCCIGFYCHTKANFDDFIKTVKQCLHPIRCPQNFDKDMSGSPIHTQEVYYPMFVFSRGRSPVHSDNELTENAHKSLQSPPTSQQPHTTIHNEDDDDDEDDEFVIL